MTNNSCNTYIIAPASHEVTMPLQPAVLACVANDVSNVTGDGTAYTVICDYEHYDQNADYNTGTGIFTSPLTGIYLMFQQLGLNVFSGNNGYLKLITSNRNYYFCTRLFTNFVAPGVNYFSGYTLTDLDAGDTSTMQAVISGGAKSVDIKSNISTLRTYFNPKLVC